MRSDTKLGTSTEIIMRKEKEEVNLVTHTQEILLLVSRMEDYRVKELLFTIREKRRKKLAASLSIQYLHPT